jgi:hypothetical protein
MYLGMLIRTSAATANAYLFKNVDGAWTQLSIQGVAGVAGLLQFEVVNDSLKLFFGPDSTHLSLVGAAFDSSLTSGSIV